MAFAPVNIPSPSAPPRPLLVVEDEPVQAALLQDALVSAGYAVEVLNDGTEVTAWVRRHEPAAILLDLVLPGKDGLALCREIRAFSTVPIIMITGRVEEIDRLLGLELGADDYVCKPFHPREVVARVRALLRRSLEWREGGDGPVSGGPTFDDERFEARWNGVSLSLTPIEFRLLKALCERPGRVLSRAKLLDVIYDDHRVVSDRTVDSHVKNLRRKIAEACPGLDPVEAIYGMGYKLVLP